MLGLDTNVLVRYITGDHPTQSQVARQVIDRAAGQGELLRICTPVLCELAWVLRGPLFGYARGEIADTIELLLEIDIFDIDARDLVRQAARGFRSGDADFSDYLIGSLNRKSGCRTTLTFDRRAGESDLFEVLGQ